MPAPADWSPTIRLSPRQHDLLSMDSYCEYGEQRSPAPELAPLREELGRGGIIHVTDLVLQHLVELADRDQDPAERTVYRNLLAKARQAKTAGDPVVGP